MKHAVKDIHGAHAGDYVLIAPQPSAAWTCSTFGLQAMNAATGMLHVRPTQITLRWRRSALDCTANYEQNKEDEDRGGGRRVDEMNNVKMEAHPTRPVD